MADFQWPMYPHTASTTATGTKVSEMSGATSNCVTSGSSFTYHRKAHATHSCYEPHLSHIRTYKAFMSCIITSVISNSGSSSVPLDDGSSSYSFLRTCARVMWAASRVSQSAAHVRARLTGYTMNSAPSALLHHFQLSGQPRQTTRVQLKCLQKHIRDS